MSKSLPLWVRVAAYGLLFALSASVVLPFIWMVLTALKTTAEINQSPFSWPATPNLGVFVDAWIQGNFTRLYLNSLGITIVAVTGLIALCSAAGYALAHYRFKGREALFLYFLAGMMIPPQVIMVPSFKLMASLGLINTYASVILTYFAWVPFAIFFFRAYFSGIPKELAEAARVEGVSEWNIFVRIMLPLAKPAMATVGIVYFIWIFNDFMWPLIYLNDQSLRTVTLGMMAFQGSHAALMNLKVAALLIATGPPLVIFLVFRRQIQSGLIEGALKA
ncbi:sugar ABC transporter permease [Kaistia sp. 32K]|uniref:carbohydrate ABC transporter permease n=1 Tax=Kaistia sp. 32K TaxID=2795690 RepID=UPI0019152B33|nr:carbohydrate ABC transporter permease [Kaistia sp. 32K]BCP55186.1 sugar ABC transporter permease [Kaistia sp. 32K]